MFRANLKQYGEFLDTIPDAALLVDRHGAIAFANAQVPALLGYAPGDLVGQLVHVLVPDVHRDDHPTHVSRFAEEPHVRQLGTRTALRAKHRDGHDVPVDIMLAPATIGRRSFTLCIVRDMTVRQSLETRVRQTDEKYRQLVEHASEVFYAVEMADNVMQGRVTYLSPQAEAMTGHPAEAFIRDPGFWLSLIHPDDLPHVAAKTAEAMAEGRATTREYRLRGADGTYRRVEDRIVPLLDAGGGAQVLQGVARDVTERWWQQHHVEVLASLGKTLRETQSRAGMVSRLLDSLLTLIDINGAAFATTDGEQLVFEHAVGAFAEWSGRRVKAAQSPSARVIRENTPWIVNRVADDPLLTGSSLRSEIQAYASIPVSVAGVAVGALIATKARAFVDREVRVLLAVGEMVAAALQRQALHEQMIERTAALEDTVERTIEGWALALDMRDRVTPGHTERVTDMTVRLAERLGVPTDQLPHIRRGAILHDVGKIAVPDHILRKRATLTEDERLVMQKHVEHAYELLWPIAFLRPSIDIPTFHHERWDGSGYPRGLKGEDIPEAARIFAVADVYDEIAGDPATTRAESRQVALAFIVAQSGRHFDPRVVEALMEIEAAQEA